MKAGILGMGIMGRLLALALYNAGWQVTLFDKNTGDNNCSLAASGLLTPFSELDKAHLLIFQLGQESITSYWLKIIEQLPEPIYFQKRGSIILNHPRDQQEWNHFSRRISSQLNATETYFQYLNHEAVIQLEPELSKFESAYYFPDEGQIDSQSLMPILKKYLKTKGITFCINSPAISLKPGQIITESGLHQFDMIFDCRGLGAQSIFADLRPLRGEVIWLHAPDVQIQRPIRLLHPRYSLYIVPRPNNVYLLGASEIEAEDYSPISVRTTLELLSAAYFVHPGFAEARIIKTVTQCRPTLSSHLPKIKYTEGLIAINGLYRHGYLLAPALAEEVLRSLMSNHKTLRYPTLWENYYV